MERTIPSNIQVLYRDMPANVHGVIFKICEDRYAILINSQDAPDQQMRTLEHELDHYYYGDLDSDDDLDLIEKMEHCMHG